MYGYNRIGPLTLEGLTQFLLLSAIQELEGGYPIKPSVVPPPYLPHWQKVMPLLVIRLTYTYRRTSLGLCFAVKPCFEFRAQGGAALRASLLFCVVEKYQEQRQKWCAFQKIKFRHSSPCYIVFSKSVVHARSDRAHEHHFFMDFWRRWYLCLWCVLKKIEEKEKKNVRICK